MTWNRISRGKLEEGLFPGAICNTLLYAGNRSKVPEPEGNCVSLLLEVHVSSQVWIVMAREADLCHSASAFGVIVALLNSNPLFQALKWFFICFDNERTFPRRLSFRSVAVSRSQDVPSFGPPIPKGVTFPKSTVFRDFLLSKVINAENAAHKSDKFGAMATRTRQEYLRDLAERHVTSTPVEPTGKFPFISLAHKRREKVRPYSGAELRSLGAITWQVHAEDQVAGAERECLLAISNDFVILLDQEAKAVVFNCATRDVIGWSTGSPASMKIYYERGESVSLRSINNNTEDFGEVVKRLEVSGGGGRRCCATIHRIFLPPERLYGCLPVAVDQGQSDHGDDAAPQRAGPAGFPRQLRGHRCRGGALRLRVAGGAQAGQPTGGDLQGGGGLAVPRADDRPPQDFCHRQSGHHSAA